MLRLQRIIGKLLLQEPSVRDLVLNGCHPSFRLDIALQQMSRCDVVETLVLQFVERDPKQKARSSVVTCRLTLFLSDKNIVPPDTASWPAATV